MLTYPCFKPGECPSTWVIELHGLGPGTKEDQWDDWSHRYLPRDYVPGIEWCAPGARCPTCSAPPGLPCDAPPDAPRASKRSRKPAPGAHYSRLLKCREKARQRCARVEHILESRARAERVAKFHRQCRAYLKRRSGAPGILKRRSG